MKKSRTNAAKFTIAVATASLVIAACGGGSSSSDGVNTPGASTLNGGGSSFVANLVDICSAQYNGDALVNPNKDTVSYSSVGSGTGKTNFASGTYKFGATDSLYSSGAPDNFVYVPLVAGPIGVGYRLDGVTPENVSLQLKAETVAKIFAGSITMWNDPAIVADNSSSQDTVSLPATPIVVAYRSGTSGTTSNFTDYLSKTSPSIWTKAANDSFTTAFPGTLPTNGTFQAASGSDGVANYVQDHNGAITYTELSYLDERAASGVKSAAVENNSGAFVLPSSSASADFFADAAVDEAGTVTKDYMVKSATAYMINAIAYGLGYKAVSTDNGAVKSYFSFFLNTCSSKNGAGAGYAPLSGSILTKALAQVAKINAG